MTNQSFGGKSVKSFGLKSARSIHEDNVPAKQPTIDPKKKDVQNQKNQANKDEAEKELVFTQESSDTQQFEEIKPLDNPMMSKSVGPSTYTIVGNACTRVESAAPKPTDFLKVDELFNKRFRVICKLHEGGYGQIYKVSDEKTKRLVVMKIEKNDDTPNMEAIVMMRFRTSPHCPKIYAKGKTKKYRFVIMQLLGKNLNELRRMCKLVPQRMSCGAALKLAIQSVRAIEGLHNIGFIHRDIKPSNFVMGCEQNDQDKLYLLDYGLARYYIKKDRTVRPARTMVAFHGTVRYASINSHNNTELSRRDDLWSLFYSFFEQFVGELPWSKLSEKNVVGDVKRKCTPEILCNSLPQEIGQYVRITRHLRYEDKPEYNALTEIFVGCMKRFTIQEKEPFDWQIPDCKVIKHWTVAVDYGLKK